MSFLAEGGVLGLLFEVSFMALMAVRLWRTDDVPSWLLGALTMAAMGIGFVLSRTTGLPGFHESEWELSGVVALVLELGFVGASVRALAPIGSPVHS